MTRNHFVLSTTAWTIASFAAGLLWAQEPANRLGDGGFEQQKAGALGTVQAVSAWSGDGKVSIVAGQGRNGTQAVQLETGAALKQKLEKLPVGVYELTTWAKGQGRLVLSDGAGRRDFALGPDWAQFSYVFATVAEAPAELTASLAGDGAKATVDDVSLTAADPELLDAWKKQEAALVQFGYVPGHLSAQRPAPQVGPVAPPIAVKPLPEKATETVIFADERYDSCWVEKPADVVDFFTRRGFRKLNAEEIGQWLEAKVKDGAYGTVCVFPSGMLPSSALGPEAIKAAENNSTDKADYRNALLRRYLGAGGRAVWMGNTTLYCWQGATGGFRGFPAPGATLLMDLGIEQRIYYGAPDDGPLLVTPAGKTWGLSTGYGPVRPVNLADVTLSFLEKPTQKASQIFLKTLNPEYPLSGLLSFPFYIKGAADQELLANAYRLALFFGKKVEVPPATVETGARPDLELQLRLGTATFARQAFVRGETISVQVTATNRKAPVSGTLMWRFVQGPKTIQSGRRPCGIPAGTVEVASFTVPTERLGVGDYEFKTAFTAGAESAIETTAPVYLRRISDNPFFMAVWGGPPANPYRQGPFFADLVAHHMNPVCGPDGADSVLRYGLRYFQRIEGGEGYPTAMDAKGAPPEILYRSEKGELAPNPWTPAKVNVGLAHPLVLAGRAHGTAEQIRTNAGAPNLFPYILTNDDFSAYYRLDWGDYVTRLFRDITGLEAPRPEHDANGLVKRAKGIIPDDDPWLQFYDFSVRRVVGEYNQAITAAKNRVLPGGRFGPVPGGMQMPLWQSAQYPPAQFGQSGFDLLSYYYYNAYWVPLTGNLYNDEMARLGNRDLPLWTTPDIYLGANEPTYYRNAFFLHLAGGVTGMNYFAYDCRLEDGWNEAGRLAGKIDELGPFLAALKPAPKKVGLYLSFAHFTCDGIYPTLGVYPFSNLLAAHVDAELTCREEVASGYASRYDAIVLWNTDWLSAAELNGLQALQQRGVKLVVDASTEVEVPGAVRLDFDIAMGKGKASESLVTEARFGRPGIVDYGHADRIAAVRDGLAKVAPPVYDSPASNLILRTFAADGVTYLWLVNIYDREEWDYINSRLRPGAKVTDKKQALAEVKEFLKARSAYDKPFTTTVTLPAGDVTVCDVWSGRELAVQPVGDGRVQCGVSMERLGGTLLALYPARAQKVTVATWPDPANPKRGRVCEVRIFDARGRLLRGAVPLRIDVRFPDGTPAPYGGPAVGHNGRYIFTITAADNEPAGTWTVAVRELAFGTQAELTTAVE